MTETIRSDARRRKNREREQSAKGDPLYPASFTEFMGAHQDQNQEKISLEHFVVHEGTEGELTKSIRRARNNKAPGWDGVQNEMLNEEPELVAKLLVQAWKLIGRTKEYTADWTTGLLTPIYKKGDRSRSHSYHPACMISCRRKVVEATIADKVAKKIPILRRQVCFQRGLSSAITLADVDAIVRGGDNRVAALDLTKAYDRVKRSILMDDCAKIIDEETLRMIDACLQVLIVSTKGGVLEREAYLRLGLTKGAPLSPILFVEYIEDIPYFRRRHTTRAVLTSAPGEAEISMTADDVVIHTKDWGSMIAWLDACSKWAYYKKRMVWKSSKCAVICRLLQQTGVEDDKCRFYTMGGQIQKTLSATYLGLTMSSGGLIDDLNVKIGEQEVKKATKLTETTRIGTQAPKSRICTGVIPQKYISL